MPTNVRLTLPAMAALAVLMGAPGAPGAGAPPGPHGPAPARSAAGPTSRPGGGSLADSVLATVGTDRRVSIADFHRAWDQVGPQARPDSLTPDAARGFLDLLVDKEVLAERATRESWVWTRKESLRYVALRDQLVLRAALRPHLDAARDSLARRGDPAADEAALGVLARDRYVAWAKPSFDDSLASRLAAAFRALPRPSADSGLFAQMRVLGVLPAIGAADSLRVLATTAEGPFLAADLMAWWRNVSPVLRPRVEGAEEVRELAGNALFERALRREAAEGRLADRPDIAAALAREREGIAVSHYVEREVYAGLETDSLALRLYFDRDPSRWALPQRVRVVRLELSTQAEAGRMGARLRDAKEVEALIGAKLPEGGAENGATPPRERFVYDLIARDDSLMFHQALRAGTGAVIGPDSVARGWAVARVVAVIPGRLRTFEEARAFVSHDWYGEEGERRMRALLDRMRRGTRVRVNERVLARLTSP